MLLMHDKGILLKSLLFLLVHTEGDTSNQESAIAIVTAHVRNAYAFKLEKWPIDLVYSVMFAGEGLNLRDGSYFKNAPKSKFY
ncbi:hypothetical protein KY290_036164 [Solanum tuberosum]|uniref:Uncharacterized protein n=1 Tax=Solanum tuberosum TaxID=4113 RepID=A0ABQ7TT92_SOLTU|nr:hypothetical protein KY290_036164 [Solanum tuberosum]